MKAEFSDQVRKILALAVEEAHSLRHDFVGPEHMLLAMVRVEDGRGEIERRGGDGQKIRAKLLESIRPGSSRRDAGPLPYTSRAKKTLEHAMAAARRAGHTTVTAEELLRGIMAEERSVAAQVLNALDLAAFDARALDSSASDGQPPESEEATVAIRIDDGSDRSIYEQIIAQVQESIAVGTLQPGQRLPPVRRLADQLDIAPGTVARAYSELERLGAVVTQGARGTHVAERRPPRLTTSARPDTLTGLLRPVAVAAFHLGAGADELRTALEVAMLDIFGGEADADAGNGPAATRSVTG